MKKNTRFYTHLVNQDQSMLNSLSTLQQYLRSHHSQFDCLHQQTQSFNVSTCNKHETIQINHNSPDKTSLVNVVFTFNISAKCFTPASPMALATRTANGVKCEKIENKNQTAGKHGDSLTDEINRIQCCVHFQRFGNLRSAICSNMVPCLFSRKKVNI